MDPYSRKRERLDVAAHQRTADCGGYTGGGDDYIEMESIAALEGYPAKIWYVVRIPHPYVLNCRLHTRPACERS